MANLPKRKIYKLSITAWFDEYEGGRENGGEECSDCIYDEEEFIVWKETSTKIIAVDDEDYLPNSECYEVNKIKKEELMKGKLLTFKNGHDIEHIFVEVWSFYEGMEEARVTVKEFFERELRKRSRIQRGIETAYANISVIGNSKWIGKEAAEDKN